MVKTLNIHLSCLCAFQSHLRYHSFLPPCPAPAYPGRGWRAVCPPSSAWPVTGAGPGAAAHSGLPSSCLIIPRVNGAPVFTLPVYKVSKAIIMTRNWRERAREETKGIYSVLIQTAFRKSLLVFSHVWEEKFIPKTKAWSSFLVSLDGSWCKCALDGAIIFFTYWLVFGHYLALVSTSYSTS